MPLQDEFLGYAAAAAATDADEFRNGVARDPSVEYYYTRAKCNFIPVFIRIVLLRSRLGVQ